MSPIIIISVCLCGGFGAAARYICDSCIKAHWHKAFPLSTFVINVVAGFLAGVVAGLYARRSMSDSAHVLLATAARWSVLRVRGIHARIGCGSRDRRGFRICHRLRSECGANRDIGFVMT